MVRIMSLPGNPGEHAGQLTCRDDGGPTSVRSLTILIVEDDPTMRLALACMVADQNCQVVLASSAEDALERLRWIEPDIILSDFMLGGMSGREFCEVLRANARWRYVPVIVVTSIDAVSIVTDLLRSGADDVMIKPVRGEELRARVLAGLRRRQNYLRLGSAAADQARMSLSLRLDVSA